MPDKSQLEQDIEYHELRRTPLSLKILIFLLLISLIAVAAYTLNLRQEFLLNEEKMVLTKKNYQKEKVQFLSDIKWLEQETAGLKRELVNKEQEILFLKDSLAQKKSEPLSSDTINSFLTTPPP